MIDSSRPDYSNTPASDCRPSFGYAPLGATSPIVSIVTPYYNTGPVFLETVRAVRRMSFANWEWIVVDDGSTVAESLRQLEDTAALDPRIRVIHQPNGGPGVARNTTFAHARGQYLFQLDSDDLVEPTFLEKAIWCLATQPHFAACGSYNVTFGRRNYLWPHGFQDYTENVDDNKLTPMALIRREAWAAAGGYDPAVSYEHADWDFWLNLAQAGHWGYTIPEYLSWYRLQGDSLLSQIEGDGARAQAFRAWLKRKHRGLRSRFPHPIWPDTLDERYTSLHEEIPVSNPLAKPSDVTRILLLVPWLAMGGADKFNLDLVASLARRGYEFTIASTAHSADPWLGEFARLTPDIFRLRTFLCRRDYPRFLNYLIPSRQIDAVVLSNSELGYQLLPYLRGHHPHLALLDFNHSEEEAWEDGGYPKYSVRAGDALDLQVTCTEHLKRWMVAHGADATGIEVVHCNVDTRRWDPQTVDVAAVRARHGIPSELPLLLFAGRMVTLKRPNLFGEIVAELAARNLRFLALVVGSGPELKPLQRFVRRRGLQAQVRCLGALPSEEVRELMAAADILLLTSEREGLALVLYEAMAMGTVPVAADVGGHAELVTPECGYLIARGAEENGADEREAYVAALERLLNDPDHRAALAAHGRQRVVESFDLALMADGMEAAVRRAQQRAGARDDPAPDLAALHARALAAVEALRRAELAEVIWSLRGGIPLVALARRLRESVIPMGSRRYERYRLLRVGLRLGLRHVVPLAFLLMVNIRYDIMGRSCGRLPGKLPHLAPPAALRHQLRSRAGPSAGTNSILEDPLSPGAGPGASGTAGGVSTNESSYTQP